MPAALRWLRSPHPFFLLRRIIITIIIIVTIINIVPILNITRLIYSMIITLLNHLAAYELAP